MTTLSQFSNGNVLVPASTSWLLADLSEFKGKQELYTQQSPQRQMAEKFIVVIAFINGILNGTIPKLSDSLCRFWI